MIERDYIMRMITTLTAVIARVLALRGAREFPRALDELRRESRSLLGVDTDLLASFDTASLSRLFGSDPHAAGAKCYAAGLILKERAEVLALMERPDEAAAARLQALDLLVEAYRITDGPVDARHEEVVEQLVDAIPLLPDPVQERLRQYRDRVPERPIPLDDE